MTTDQLAGPAGAAAAQLAGALAGWLPQQRWFAGKGRPVSGVAPVRAVTLYERGHDGDDHPERLDQLVVEVRYDDGASERYQVLVGWRRDLPERLEHMRIGEVAGPDGGWLVGYDGIWDDELAAAVLGLIASGADRGGVRFVPEADARLRTNLPSRVIDAEQSNSSIVYDESLILKLFRRVTPGQNPDLAVNRALHRLGCSHVAELLGGVESEVDGEPVSHAMLSRYEANAADGWAMATASMRDLLAEADLRADEVGGDFAAEAERLGEAVAAVHADLARALGTGELTSAELAELAQQMLLRLDLTLPAVPELDEFVEPLRKAFTAVVELPAPVPIQRIHGDLHLGQVLRTLTTWLLIDFEGEPVKSLSERVRPDSPLRDVAGMLRSFDYAARQLLGENADHQLEYRAMEWAERNRGAFCAGYAAASGTDPRDWPVLLRAYELDKAVYETLYETRNRPPWRHIPLRSIARLVEQ